MKRTIALVGLRASGKTSVGCVLAELLQVPFVDLDEEVVRASELDSISDIFMTLGEPAFREIESGVLEDALAHDKPMVIATGGGVIERERNRRLLAEHAIVVWLDVPVAELQRRLRADSTHRPALLGRDAAEEVPSLSSMRAPAYAAAADWRIDAGGLAPLDLARRIAAHLHAAGWASRS